MISDCPFKVASSGVSWWSPVLRRGARKQSTQFNNHPGCLNRTREARLSVYFPCIALRLPFNFMAKWTSLTSCAPSPLSPRPGRLHSSPSPLFSSLRPRAPIIIIISLSHLSWNHSVRCQHGRHTSKSPEFPLLFSNSWFQGGREKYEQTHASSYSRTNKSLKKRRCQSLHKLSPPNFGKLTCIYW